MIRDRLEDTSLALDVLDNLGVKLVTLLHTNGRGKGLVWLPLGRGTWSGLLHHFVNLLESKTLGLWDEEVSVDKGACAQTTPDEEDGRAEVTLSLTDHVWSDDGNDGVPEPVGGGGESDTTGTDWKREDLTDDDPGTWTPGGGEEEDEDGNEGDLSVDGGDVVGNGVTGSIEVGVVETNGNTDDGNEELADQHTKGTPDEKRTTTDLLHGDKGDWSRADVDEGEDEGDQESVLDGASRLQERSGIVEDEVDTGPLLHHLEGGTENGLAEVGVGREDGTTEAVGPSTDPASSWNHGALVLLVGDNLGKLGLDVLRVGWLTTEAAESLASLLDTATLDKVTWGVWKEEETTTKNDTEDELDADWDAVRASVGAVLSGIVDARSEEETNGNTELVSRDESATNLTWADLGHVENDNCGFETDTETSDETTSDNETKTVGSDLKNDTDDVDEATNDDSVLATEDFGDITGDDSTEKGTGREDRDDKRVVGRGQGIEWATRLHSADEDTGGSDTVDVTRIITEEDTSERGKGADEVGLEGDWRLDALDIVGGCESCSRHDGQSMQAMNVYERSWMRGKEGDEEGDPWRF